MLCPALRVGGVEGWGRGVLLRPFPTVMGEGGTMLDTGLKFQGTLRKILPSNGQISDCDAPTSKQHEKHFIHSALWLFTLER